MLRPMRYPSLARQGESAGATILRLDSARLWHQFETTRFYREVVGHLSRGLPLRQPELLLDHAQLGLHALRQDEFFDYQPDVQPLELTRASLLAVAGTLEDLACDDHQSQWKDRAADLDHPVQEAIAQFAGRVRRLQRRALLRHGPDAAQRVLEILRARFVEVQTKPPTAWSTRRSDALTEAAQQVRNLLRPRGSLWSNLARFSPGLSPTWWLSASQRNALRRVHGEMKQAAQDRHDQELHQRKHRVHEAMLGTPGQLGIIDLALEDLAKYRSFFTDLASAPEEPEPTLEPQAISLVRNLDTMLNPTTKQHFGDLMAEAVRQAGCSARALAQRIARRGLRIDGRRYRVAEWTTLALPVVRAALLREVRRYLGSADGQVILNPDQPQTAFQYAARITLLHPALSGLLLGALPALARQSLPYAQVHDLGKPRQARGLLFCFPPDRARWAQLLGPHVTLVNAPHEADAFATRHPYVVLLCQYALELPLGGLKALPHWIHQGIQVRQAGTVEPLYDRTAYPEMRRLPQRPDELADAAGLFAAALRGKIILPRDASHYVLAQPDERFESLFATPVIQAQEVADTVILDHLRNQRFCEWLDRVFPAVPGLRAQLRRLAQYPEGQAPLVAEELVKLGIVQPGIKGHYRFHCQLPADEPVAKKLFRRIAGETIGLCRDDFIGEIHRNDELYNAIFWAVLDALADGRIVGADVPAFLAACQRRL